MSVEIADEGRHEKTDALYWRESYYFNFVDRKSGAHGFTTIGWRVNEKEVDGLLITILGKTMWFAYPAVNRPFNEAWESIKLPENLRVGKLHYDMIEPFKKWRLVLDGRKTRMDLTFDCFTPVYDYNFEKRSIPEKVAANHYEQSGRVTGVIEARGERIDFDGTGQRDHSWGIRDWGGVDSWRWTTAQFGDKFSFNVFAVTDGGVETAGGFVFTGAENRRIVDSRIDLDFMSDGQTPRVARLWLKDERGDEHKIVATVFHCVPLKRHEAFIKECFAIFEYNGMVGAGVVERLHRIRSKFEKAKYIFTAADYGLRSALRNFPIFKGK